MLARNARQGARMMYQYRWSTRKRLWEAWRKKRSDHPLRGLRNMVFPRLTYHLIYVRLFGVRHWLSD